MGDWVNRRDAEIATVGATERQRSGLQLQIWVVGTDLGFCGSDSPALLLQNVWIRSPLVVRGPTLGHPARYPTGYSHISLVQDFRFSQLQLQRLVVG
jgi:hypothetical protein